MTVREALREGVAALGGSGTPFLDASLLLGKALGLDAAGLYAAGPEPVEAAGLAAYRALLERRAEGLNVAYILGEKEFWGRRFRVDRRVLVPRPETETLVVSVLETCGGRASLRLHEVCCGSACVALSLAAERPLWEVSASDLSAAALEVAAENAELLLPADRPGGPCRLGESDLLGSVRGPFDAIAANPPYIPTAELESLAPELGFEPRMALDGGPDGLELYRRLAPQAATALAPGGWIFLEADGSQAADVRSLLEGAGFVEISTLPDLAGIERITRGRLSWKT